MPLRYREIRPTVTCIYTNKSTGNSVTAERALSNDRIEDYTGPGDGQDLDIDHISVIGLGPVTGENSTHRWENFLPGGLFTGTSHASNAQLGIPSYGSLATSLLVKTTPNRSDIDLPVSMAELRELPSLLKKWGDNIFQKIATGNLTWSFSIAPLINDILSVCNLISIVEARIKEVNALIKSGLRRKRSLGYFSYTADSSVSMQSGSGTQLNLSTSYTKTTFAKVWGFVKYEPTEILKSMSNDQLLTACRNAALGLHLDGYAAWNLIPWSWLIDWFFNFGDWLALRRNDIPCKHSKPLIMVERVTFLNHRNSANNAWPKRFTTKVVSKGRTSQTSTISTKMSLLSQKQWSLLGSLAVLGIR